MRSCFSLKFFCISCCEETICGLRLAGIEGILVKNSESLEKTLNELKNNPEIGIVLITTEAIELNLELIRNFKLKNSMPLIFEFPNFNDESINLNRPLKYEKSCV